MSDTPVFIGSTNTLVQVNNIAGLPFNVRLLTVKTLY